MSILHKNMHKKVQDKEEGRDGWSKGHDLTLPHQLQVVADMARVLAISLMTYTCNHHQWMHPLSSPWKLAGSTQVMSTLQQGFELSVKGK